MLESAELFRSPPLYDSIRCLSSTNKKVFFWGGGYIYGNTLKTMKTDQIFKCTISVYVGDVMGYKFRPFRQL